MLESPSSETAELTEYFQRLAEAQNRYRTEVDELHRLIENELRAYASDYLIYVVKSNPLHRPDGQNPLKTDRTILRGPSAYGFGAIARWQHYLETRRKDDLVWGIWRRLESVGPEHFCDELTRVLDASDGTNAQLRAAIQSSQPTTMVELARCYGTLLEATHRRWQMQIQQEPGARSFADPHDEGLRRVLYGSDSPAVMSPDEAVECYRLDEHTRIRNLRGKIEEVSANDGSAPPRPMMLTDRSTPLEPRIFVRGQPQLPGRRVPRAIPSLFSELRDDYAIHSGSGRKQLAGAIVDRRNPLTRRVIVNRIWQWHFGQGLVTTASDFGTRSDPPSHPELLDYLAEWFADHRWSLQQLHRLIVTSRTYQQASHDRPALRAVDPENRLWGQFAAPPPLGSPARFAAGRDRPA